MFIWFPFLILAVDRLKKEEWREGGGCLYRWLKLETWGDDTLNSLWPFGHSKVVRVRRGKKNEKRMERGTGYSRQAYFLLLLLAYGCSGFYFVTPTGCDILARGNAPGIRIDKRLTWPCKAYALS
jgi:hypothetical protein